MKHCFGSSSPNSTLRDVYLVMSIISFLSSQSCIFCMTIKMNPLGKDSCSRCSETGFMSQFCQFLGALAKLRKAAITFTISISLSVRAHGTSWPPLDGFSYDLIIEKFSKIQVSLKFDKNNGYFTWRRVYIYDNISLNSS
jgi:hypothetical protein